MIPICLSHSTCLVRRVFCHQSPNFGIDSLADKSSAPVLHDEGDQPQQQVKALSNWNHVAANMVFNVQGLSSEKLETQQVVKGSMKAENRGKAKASDSMEGQAQNKNDVMLGMQLF